MRPWSLAILLILLVMIALPARADFPEGIPDKIRFGAGGMWTVNSTSGAVGREQGGVGVYVNLEDVFNLPGERNVFAGTAEWRVKGKHSIDFGYTGVNRESSRVIEQNVEWGNYVFTGGAKVDFKWNLRFPYVAYRYDFLNSKKVIIGGSAGISYFGLTSGLQADGGVTDLEGNPVTGSINEGTSLNFPVPLVGLQLDWAFAKRFALRTYMRFLYIDVSGFKGSHRMTGMIVDYFPTKHFGIGVGYNNILLDLKEFTSGDKKGKAAIGVQGFSLMLKGTF